jgi:hypothetical protein
VGEGLDRQNHGREMAIRMRIPSPAGFIGASPSTG